MKKVMSQPVHIRYQVLKIYKTFIRLSQTWTSSVPSQTGIEKNYIIEETRKLFKANKSLTKPHEISEALREAEARLAMAQHYRNPYPRSSSSHVFTIPDYEFFSRNFHCFVFLQCRSFLLTSKINLFISSG